ncbi:MAG TPA: hypothetical protein GXZ48_02785 [Acholeplasmataceae bacterium]|nr:hypothetical protein [Acholeplasmataceae bacterium]
MFDILIDIGKSLAVTVLIFFIINNAFSTHNYKRKALIFFLTGLILLLGMFIAHLFDRFVLDYKIFPARYFAFPIAVLIVTIFLVSINLYRGNKYHHKLKGYERQVNNEENYLYVLYQYKDYYYLYKNNDTLSGDVVKFSRNIYFHDQMINVRINQLKLNPKAVNYIGKFSASEKQKDFVFFCYLVELNNDDHLEKFIKVDMYEIQNLKTLDFHKNIILRILIKEEFDIKL